MSSSNENVISSVLTGIVFKHHLVCFVFEQNKRQGPQMRLKMKNESGIDHLFLRGSKKWIYSWSELFVWFFCLVEFRVHIALSCSMLIMLIILQWVPRWQWCLPALYNKWLWYMQKRYRLFDLQLKLRKVRLGLYEWMSIWHIHGYIYIRLSEPNWMFWVSAYHTVESREFLWLLTVKMQAVHWGSCKLYMKAVSWLTMSSYQGYIVCNI